jgi:glycosyltransferase involved in cell wall biosynthesis
MKVLALLRWKPWQQKCLLFLPTRVVYPEINIDGYCGYMSDVGDVDDMSKNALKILKDEETLLKFKANALLQAKKFDIQNIVPLYEQLYNSVI